MKRLIICLAVLLIGACSSPEGDQKSTALVEYGKQVEASGLPDRLAALDRRLAAIETQLGELTKKLESGIRMAAPPVDTNAAPIAGKVVGVLSTDGAETEIKGNQPVAVKKPFSLTYEPIDAAPIVLWHPYRGAEKEALEKSCRDFSAQFPSIQVNPQEVPFMALRDKIVVTVPRGTGPDLFIYVHNPIGDWLYKGKILVPLSSYIEKFDTFERLQQFIPDTVKALAYDGTLYGLPMAFKARAMFYNKAIIKQVPRTMDELVSVALEASTGEGEERVYGLIYEAGLLFHHAPFAHGFGAKILDDQGNVHLNTPEFVQSVQLIRDLVAKDKVLPDLNKDMAKFLFNSNQAGIVFKGPWFLGEIDEGIEYGVALMPEVAPGKPSRPYLGADGIFLAECSKDKDAAFQVMRYLTSRVSAEVRYLEGGQLVANKAIYDDPELKKKANPALEVFRAQADSAVVMPARPEMQAVWSTTDNALRKAIFGGTEIQATLDEAQSKITTDIANMGKN
jgi:arabinogalactan oligomer / maltooligosaccharide transport system substrate-binding protein